MPPIAPLTTVAISTDPRTMNELPAVSVLRTPKRLMASATSGPGSPDMIMYTENRLPRASRCSPSAVAMAALMTAGLYAGNPRLRNITPHSDASMVQP